MTYVQDATSEFVHQEGPVRFTVLAWNLVNTASAVDAAYRSGNMINVNPRKLLLEPELVTRALLQLEPSWLVATVAAAVFNAGQRLRAVFALKTDAHGEWISLGDRRRPVPPLAGRKFDFWNLSEDAARERLRDEAREQVADALATRTVW